MSVDSSWVPVTPVKPPSSRSSHEEEKQQKSDGSYSSSAGEAQAGKVLACSDTPNFVTLNGEKILVVDLSEMNWDENAANCCSISASSEKAESSSTNLRINEDIIPQVSHYAVSSKTIPHFVPMTPDKRIIVESKQVVQVQSLPTEDERYEEGLEQEYTTVNTRTDGNDLEQEVCELVLDSTSAAVLTPFKDNPNSDKESNTVNVNEITQVKQRRRKHRPKVIAEDKPTPKPVPQKAATANSKENLTGKRKYVRKNAVNKPPETPLELGTPNTDTPKVAGSKENSTGKRKYVRKNVVKKTTETPPVEKIGVSTDKEVPKRTRKTCRRSLKFDNVGEQKDESSSCKYSSKISESQLQILTTVEVQSHSNVQHWRESQTMFDHSQVGILYDPNPSMNQPVKDCECLPESQVSSLGTPIDCSSSQLKLQINYHKGQESGGKINSKNETHFLSSSKDSICSTTTISTERNQARDSKRKCCHSIKEDDIRSSDIVEEFYNSPYAYQMPPSEYFPYIHKRAKTHRMPHSTTSSMYSNVPEQAYLINNPKENPSTTEATYWIPRPQTHCCLIPRILGESADLHNELQPFEFSVASSQVEMSQRRCKACAHVQTMGSWSHTAQSNIQSTYSPKHLPVITDFQIVENSHGQVNIMQATMARNKQTENSFTWVSSNTDGAQQHAMLALYSHHQNFQRSAEAPSDVNSEQTLSIGIADINRENKISLHEEQNAMVPYNMQNQRHNALVVYGRDGSVVPFEGFLPVKKRRQHAKVDLDGETIRVWKLLMETFDSEGIDGSDEDRVKWWEEERRVFCGRADSFIARMHLIQGDRRFSQWKGSVLDSVIGVFLTQNVSDHLSSSAFMSLAARFPLKSRNHNKSCFDDGTSLVVEEPEVIVWRAEDGVNWNKQISDEPICKPSCMTVHETEKTEEKVLTSSESSGSNMAGVSSTHECQLLTSAYSSQKIGERESQRSTTEINTSVEACPFGDGKVVDTAMPSQLSIFSQHSLHSSFSSSIEDRQPSLKSNSDRYLSNPLKDTSVNGSISSVKVIQIAETTMLKTDCKDASGNDSSEDKSEDDCRKAGEKYDDQRENNGNSDCPKSFLGESPCHSSNHQLQKTSTSGVTEVESFEMCREDAPFFYVYEKRDGHDTNEQMGALDSASQTTVHNKLTTSAQATTHSSELCNVNQCDQDMICQCQGRLIDDPQIVESQASVSNHKLHQNLPDLSVDTLDIMGKNEESDPNKHNHLLDKKFNDTKADILNSKGKRVSKEKKDDINWDNLRKRAEANGRRERTKNTMDSLDWEAVRCAHVDEIAYTIRERGMNNRLAERIKDFLNRLVKDHGSIDLEWLRDVSPDQAKEYLLSVKGLGLKSVECVRLLTLHQLAFPVDTNVGRIAVRLGWVPLRPLPESLQLHLLELYPVLESIQKYLWPRLCKLDQRTLYELHYQLITFGKVFCTKSKPNCNACPMRGECRHFASAFASARLALPAPEEKSLVDATERKAYINQAVVVDQQPLILTQASNPTEKNLQSTHQLDVESGLSNIEPIIEEPATPEPEYPQISENDIEDTLYEDLDEIPTIKLNIEAFTRNLQNYMQENMELQESSMSKALVVLSPEAASIPMPKLKNISRLRTEHQVYELPDSHPLLEKLKLEQREPDDPCFYLLAIWTPGETENSIELPHTRCSSQENGEMCGEKECFSCNSVREANSQMVRGTILIPCRTTMRGSFPLNGTYFQVNEVFADHDSSINPIDVPRAWLWNLSRRTVYFGTSIPTIFKGLSTEDIQHCFWRGYVCVRGFDQKTRAPRPLIARLHFPASKLSATKGKTGKPDDK